MTPMSWHHEGRSNYHGTPMLMYYVTLNQISSVVNLILGAGLKAAGTLRITTNSLVSSNPAQGFHIRIGHEHLLILIKVDEAHVDTSSHVNSSGRWI